MKKDYNCQFGLLYKDVNCEHKKARINPEDISLLHSHDGYEVVLYLGGDVSIYVEAEGKQMERGDIALIPPNSFHGLYLTDIPSYERIVLNFREEYLRSFNDTETDLSLCFKRLPENRLNVIHLNDEQLQDFIRIGDSLADSIENSAFGGNILQRAFFSEFLVKINRVAETAPQPYYSSTVPPVVKKIFDFVTENLTSDLTVEMIALNLHHNSDYLNRSFKKVTGYPLKHYIIAKKLTLAQQYLRQGYSPYDACFMSGYNNYSSFSRRFTEAFKISPKAYQLKCQSAENG
ncbi:MAG: helix-turn-helix domain-containing protein [Lachnospiraceae bacterium]|nr:helix-turn-helix domain-containing protein [Lachnospiraceae bacterium]